MKEVEMGRIDGEGDLLQVESSHRGWLVLKNSEGETLKKKCRVGDFEIDADAEPFHEGEVFINDDGKAVNAEGEEIAEGEDDDEEEEDDGEDKVMSALKRRKEEGAYEVIDLGDGKKTTVSKDAKYRQPDLDQFVGDLPGLFAYAEEEMGMDPGFFADKYGKLNAGQQRMNVGNRLRGFRAKNVMVASLGEELGLSPVEMAGLGSRVGKGAITEKKLRALHAADKAEAAKAEEAPVEA